MQIAQQQAILVVPNIGKMGRNFVFRCVLVFSFCFPILLTNFLVYLVNFFFQKLYFEWFFYYDCQICLGSIFVQIFLLHHAEKKTTLTGKKVFFVLFFF